MDWDPKANEDSNRSGNPALHDLAVSRRTVLGAGVAGALMAALGVPARSAAGSPSRLGFAGVSLAEAAADGVTVPEGYVATAAFKWGEPVGIPGNMPDWRKDAGNSAAEQAAQLGMHHDGMHFFPLSKGRGLLVMNHEYVDDGLLHVGGMADWSAEKVAKSIAAHGVSVIEVAEKGGTWHMVRPSPLARRITAATPMAAGGPAAGHALMRTAADPEGRTILGTLNNCAHGFTPWGTYLTCEENWSFYFNGPEAPDADQARYGLKKGGRAYRWHEFEERFDATRHANEFHRFGWVVEIDPHDPAMKPVKRTALGRGAHEGATVAQTRDGRAVVYMGEDAQFEYVYKFVSRDRVRPGGFSANRDLLDHGTLYVARFDADGRGRWLPLVFGEGPLNAANGFADQGEVVVKARQAADALGATRMDRPEWIAVDPADGAVYCTLTNNSRRGTPDHPGTDAANPRAVNSMGQILRWREDGDHDATAFSWDLYVLAGDPAAERAEAKGNVRGDAFGCPDGLVFDGRGLLWIHTDIHASQMGKGDFAGIARNALLVSDTATGEVRRFLVGPPNCEITGATFAPDMRTLFVNVQHPGETPSDRSDPADPMRYSAWPDGTDGGRPRSATVVVRRRDGGIVGS